MIVQPSEHELKVLWEDNFGNRHKSSLNGKIVTLDELIAAFPEGKDILSDITYGQVSKLRFSERPYAIYGRQITDLNKDPLFFERLAYECTNLACNKIIVSPPRFYDMTNQSRTSGFKGYSASCILCNHTMDVVTTEFELI